MAQFITRTFLRGLAVVAPIGAALYIVFWMARESEALIKVGLLRIIPDSYYVPGLGVTLVVAGVFVVGLLMYPLLTRILLDGIDQVLRKIPLIGMVYSPIRDLMDMLGGDVTDKFGQVVMVTVPGTGLETIGFVMQNDTAKMPDGFSKDDHVVVYLQMSYQIGGYCFVVPRSSIRPVDMSVQQAIRWVLMAGVSGGGKKEKPKLKTAAKAEPS